MAHYFSADPVVASRPRTVTFTLDGRALDLTTDTGVFSADGVDAGTRVLLNEVPSPPPGPVTLADVGCGYGPIAITLALRAAKATVWAIDVNQRALELCRANAEAAGVGDRIHAVTPDEVPPELRLDGFWSNPPIRIGKPALHDLLLTWFTRLDAAAKAHLVVHKHLGSDSLAKWIDAQGYAVQRLISRDGYRVLEITAPSGASE